MLSLSLRAPRCPHNLRAWIFPFELKSATKGKPNISTVRDFGLHYIEKWRSLHWLFGVYGQAGGELKLLYCLYGSPKQMKPWFDRMAAYIAPDIVLAETVPDLLDDEILSAVMSEAEDFGYEDAHQLMKNQYKRQGYRDAADLPGERYSRAAMLEMLRLRSRYVIERGSTLNNPHISPATSRTGSGLSATTPPDSASSSSRRWRRNSSREPFRRAPCTSAALRRNLRAT